MDIELVVKDGPHMGQVLRIKDARSVEIGRDPAADLVLAQDAFVSRHHCVIAVFDDGAWLQDSGSTHGTYLNSRDVHDAPSTSLDPGAGSLLASGDVITVGETAIEVWVSGVSQGRPRPTNPYEIPGFTLVKPLAVNGARLVYLAVPTAAARPVMLHFLPLSEVGNPKETDRMQHEQMVLARLQQDRRIPELKQVGLTRDAMWFVTSYVDAMSLAEYVAQRGPLQPDVALDFAWQAADVLTQVHAASIIHRGLNPNSYWINLRGRALDVYLVDLATARWTQLERAITSTRGVRTSLYIAPELSINSRLADQRSDIYSLGAIMYFAITGHAPHDGEDHQDQAPRKPPGGPVAPGTLNQDASARYFSIIEQAMAGEPTDRIPTAVSLRDGLKQAIPPPPSEPSCVTRRPLTYLDFDLLIERGFGTDKYQARVIHAPGGETPPVSFTMPFSPLELQKFLQRIDYARWAARTAYAPGFDEAKEFGSALYEKVFSGPIESNLNRSLGEARARQDGLRVLLRLSDVPELAALPWEFLYDRRLDRFLCVSAETPVVRFLEVPDSVRWFVADRPIRILVVIAAPVDYPWLDVNDEWAKIQQEFGPLTRAGLVDLQLLEGGTVAALGQRLRREVWHVLHFIGHATFDTHDRTGMLLFEDQHGRSHMVDAQTFGMMLHDHQLRLVVLNACDTARGNAYSPFAGIAQTLLQQGIPSVIAMQFPITDGAAIILTQNLYQAIAEGHSVEAAMSAARQAIWSDSNRIEWATPVLYSRGIVSHLITIE